jgi:hypothetical protein
MRHFLLTALLIISCIALPVQAAALATDKQQAVDIAQQEFPGRVLSVKNKGEYFHVKILSDSGEVRIVKVKTTGNGNRKQK